MISLWYVQYTFLAYANMPHLTPWLNHEQTKKASNSIEYTSQVATVFNASTPTWHQLRDGDVAPCLLPAASAAASAAAADDIPIFATDNASDTETQIDSTALLHPKNHHDHADNGADTA